MSGSGATAVERRAWAAGIVFVVALVAETAITAAIPINQDDSAAKIAGALHEHRTRLLLATYLRRLREPVPGRDGPARSERSGQAAGMAWRRRRGRSSWPWRARRRRDRARLGRGRDAGRPRRGD